MLLHAREELVKRLARAAGAELCKGGRLGHGLEDKQGKRK
jgi:hypothetical protein